MRSEFLVWADTETTGLEPDALLLEAAFVVTDRFLRPVGDPFEVVIGHSDEALDCMIDEVRDMHTRSGLLEAVRASQVTVSQAAEAAFGFVTSYVSEPRTARLCGSSVWFDRHQMSRWMPALHTHLYHRMIDVSAVKELVAMWCPRVYEGLASGPAAGGKTHRALADVLDSIAELSFYRDTIFPVEL